MRKIIGCLLVLIMMVVPFASYAASVEIQEFVFSEYTDDYLLKMITALQQEIVSREIEKTAVLPAGIYNVGVDLPIGTYRLTVELEEDEYCQIIITQKLEEPVVENMPTPNENMPATQMIRTEDNIYNDIVRTGDEPIHISLLAGQCLKLSNEAKLTIDAGILFE